MGIFDTFLGPFRFYSEKAPRKFYFNAVLAVLSVMARRYGSRVFKEHLQRVNLTLTHHALICPRVRVP